MTGTGHRLAALGPAIAGAVLLMPSSTAASIAFAVGAMLGSVGPDILEVPIGEHRLIPHRTVTHTALIWAAVLAALLTSLHLNGLDPLTLFAAGFSTGGLSHLSGDVLTPSGIPLWHPMRRWSARLCRAGGIGEAGWIASTWLVSYTAVHFLSAHTR